MHEQEGAQVVCSREELLPWLHPTWSTSRRCWMTPNVSHWCASTAGRRACAALCDSGGVIRDGHDDAQPCRQPYQCRCKACSGRFDDLTGTVLAGHHQPLRVWVLYLHFMSWRGAWIDTSNFSSLGNVKNAFGVRIGIVHTATNAIRPLNANSHHLRLPDGKAKQLKLFKILPEFQCRSMYLYPGWAGLL